MIDLAAQITAWMAAGAALMALVAALALFNARSLFAVSVALGVLCACAGVALAALGYGDGALALALLGAGVAPVVLLGGVLLSARAVKPRKRGMPWATMAAAAAAAAAVLWTAPSLEAGARIAAPSGGVSIALVAILFVAAAAGVAMLGYGERGVLHADEEQKP